ncbi:MAG: iron-siderophore ABC transporter substrate-binding protein, partial [Mesorhizobium sp.]
METRIVPENDRRTTKRGNITRRAALGLFLLPMAASAEARPLRIVC